MAKTDKEKETLTGKKLVKKGEAKTPGTRVVKAKTGSGKKSTKEQIEEIERALDEVSGKDMIDLLPEEVKKEIEEDETEKIFEPEVKKVEDVKAELKDAIEKVQPSDEIVQEFTEFEGGKNEFDKKIDNDPKNAEKLIQEEIKRVEVIKKRVEKLQKMNEKQINRDNFTNIWNGMGYDF